jgi:hypothetical protein
MPAQVEPGWSATTLVIDLLVGQSFCMSTWNPARVEQLRQSATQRPRGPQLRNSATEACERSAASVTSPKPGREERRRRTEHAREGVPPARRGRDRATAT